MSQHSQFTFHEVNAFTQKGMAVVGNPATICLVQQFPDDRIMGLAAKKLARPMTSFVRQTDDPHIFEIRHFSPDGEENHVCGHATLAASEFLATTQPALRQGQEITFRLNPKYAINAANNFKAYIKGDNISLTMPAITELKKVSDPEFYKLLAEALRIDESDIVKPAYYAPRIINYVVEFNDQAKLLSTQPDFKKLKALALSIKFPHEGIMATVQSEDSEYDIMSRVFLPVIDVDEDIACGSSCCSIIPYWASFNKTAFPAGKQQFTHLFPYPPVMHLNQLGGLQHVDFNELDKEIILTGQASYVQAIAMSVQLGASPSVNKPSDLKP